MVYQFRYSIKRRPASAANPVNITADRRAIEQLQHAFISFAFLNRFRRRVVRLQQFAHERIAFLAGHWHVCQLPSLHHKAVKLAGHYAQLQAHRLRIEAL